MAQPRSWGRLTFLVLVLVGAVVALARQQGWLEPWLDPSTRVRQPAFPVIDMHTHLSHKTLKQTVALMDRLGIRTMVNLSGGSPGMGLAQQLQASRQFPGRFVVFTTPDFSLLQDKGGAEKLAQALKRAVAMGARGLKIYKSLGLHVQGPDGRRLPVDAALLSPLWKMAGQLKIPVAIHTGDPQAFFKPITPKNERYEELSLNPQWSFADRRRFPSWETLYREFLSLVAKHPKTTFIGLHFGNCPEDVTRVGKALSRYKNLYIDVAARLPEIGRQDTEKVRKVFLTHADRILFGTDLAMRPAAIVDEKGNSKLSVQYTLGAPMPNRRTHADALRYFYRHWTFFETGKRGLRNPTPIQGRWPIHAIQLPPKVLKKLYYENARRLLRLPK